MNLSDSRNRGAFVIVVSVLALVLFLFQRIAFLELKLQVHEELSEYRIGVLKSEESAKDVQDSVRRLSDKMTDFYSQIRTTTDHIESSVKTALSLSELGVQGLSEAKTSSPSVIMSSHLVDEEKLSQNLKYNNFLARLKTVLESRAVQRSKFPMDWLCNSNTASSLRSQIDPSGLFLEFGVYKGSSITNFAIAFPNVKVFGFDTFTGLPESWRPNFGPGLFSLDGKLPAVPGNVELVKGLFQDTFPGFLREHTKKASFVHIDCDLYSATEFVLDSLLEANQLPSGVVLLFDELVNYPKFEDHEVLALWELMERTGRQIEVVAFHGKVDLNPLTDDIGSFAVLLRLL